MSSISSIISNNRGRTSRTAVVAIGAIIVAVAVAATSVAICHSRRRQQKDDDDGTENSTADDESNFYKQIGISEENLPSHIQREIYKERKRKSKMKSISMKKPMYDNVYMLDTNGEQVCTISMRKANWYINKRIAKWSTFKEGADSSTTSLDNTKEEGEVKCIRLLFEHKGSKSKETTPETTYLRTAKKNICVACGGGGHHIRHYIIPFAYRTLLPDEYKLHMSHDVVILCSDCHLDCDRKTKIRMTRMETDLRMEMGGGASSVSPFIEDKQLSHIRSWAIALIRSKDKMPTEKVQMYEKTIREYLASVCNDEEEKKELLEKEELTKSQLQQACGVDYRVKNPNYVPGAEIVVGSLKERDSIEAFIINWRKHFIDTAIPRHMPDGWRVDNPVVYGSWSDLDGHAAGLK